MRPPLIGHVPGVAPGARFDTRAEAHAARVHRELQAGICGRPDSGAESIVLAGGYRDDRDLGDRILYTGAGARDPETKRQVAHQSFGGTRAANWNRALAVSADNALPVRVLRGHQSRHGPSAGYRYDGLWRVTDYRMEPGEDGFRVCTFELVPLDDAAIEAHASGFAEEEQDGYDAAPRVLRSGERIVRDPRNVLAIKVLYDYQCQACGTRVETLAGPYGEAAHIRPLGAPHSGPDVVANMLCLCPNCHSAFDRGGWTVRADGAVEWVDGRTDHLRVKAGHGLDRAQLTYHRVLWCLE